MNLFTYLGTEVKLHWSLIIPFAITAFTPAYFLVLLMVFVIVLAHEFGHIAAARKFGMQVPRVWLSAIGGAAVSEEDFPSAWSEFVVTFCGPLVNVVLMLLAIPLAPFVPGEAWAWFMVINFYILLFNLIPAFPMDGGRLLHSFLWFAMPKWIATRICIVLSCVLSAFGIYLAVFDNQWVLGIISVFIVFASASEWNDTQNPSHGDHSE